MDVDDVLSRMEEHFHVLHLGEKSRDFGKVLSTDTGIKILETVYSSDNKVGLSASEISKVLGMGRTTAIYHLSRMQESGLIKINPILEHDEKWEEFWSLYKKKSADVSKEQFSKLHDAHMNGVKLFVSTKKGFLILPSTDVKEGQSIVKEALASVTAPAVEKDYKKLAKSTSLLGTVGLLFIALSFLLQGLPFLQYDAGGEAPASFMKAPENAYASGLGEPGVEGDQASPAATMSPSQETLQEERAYADVENKKITEDLSQVKAVSTPKGQSTIQEEAKRADKMEIISRVFAYVGTLLLGSVLGFLFYSYVRRR